MASITRAVERNGYGRQIDSRIALIDLNGELNGGPAEAVFVRAPIIREAGPAIQVLASYLDHPVLLDNGFHVAATFHPELGRDVHLHESL